MKRLIGIFVPLLYLAVSAGTSRADQIAQLTEISPAQNFVFYENGVTQSLTATSEVAILFYTGPLSGAAVPATFVLTATSPVGNISGGTPDSHGDFSGSFSVTDNSGNDLLSGSFSGTGVLSGSSDDQTATFSVSGDSWIQSNAIALDPSANESLAITLSDFGSVPGDPGYVEPGLDAVGVGTINGQTLPGSGPDPEVSTTPTTADADPPTPEPETYLMAGGALAGISIFLRRRRAKSGR